MLFIPVFPTHDCSKFYINNKLHIHKGNIYTSFIFILPWTYSQTYFFSYKVVLKIQTIWLLSFLYFFIFFVIYKSKRIKKLRNISTANENSKIMNFIPGHNLAEGTRQRLLIHHGGWGWQWQGARLDARLAPYGQVTPNYANHAGKNSTHD